MQMNDFFYRLKEERKKLDKNQADFGELCGVTKLTQSNYENGKRKPDIEYLSRAGEAGCDIQYIITGKRAYSNDFDLNIQERAIDIVVHYISLSGKKLTHPEMFYPIVMDIYQIIKDVEAQGEEVDPIQLGAKVISLFAA